MADGNFSSNKFVNLLISFSISLTTVLFAFYLSNDPYATKEELKYESQLLTKEIEKTNIKVNKNSEEIDEVKDQFLQEIRDLRKDLNLKVDKS